MVKKKKSKKLNYLQIIGILLITTSIIYFGHSTLRVMDRKREIEKGKIDFIKTAKLNNVNKKNKAANSIKTTQRKDILVENLNEGSQAKRMYKNIDKNLSDAIGYIEIDKIGVILPIFPGTSKRELRAGVGLLESTDDLTNEKNTISVIAGHRGGYNGEQSFLNIDNLKKGDKIKITTKEKILVYKVIGQNIIASTDWSKFTRDENKTKLILMSCHPYPQNYQRLLINAELISSQDL